MCEYIYNHTPQGLKKGMSCTAEYRTTIRKRSKEVDGSVGFKRGDFLIVFDGIYLIYSRLHMSHHSKITHL